MANRQGVPAGDTAARFVAKSRLNPSLSAEKMLLAGNIPKKNIGLLCAP